MSFCGGTGEYSGKINARMNECMVWKDARGIREPFAYESADLENAAAENDCHEHVLPLNIHVSVAWPTEVKRWEENPETETEPF